MKRSLLLAKFMFHHWCITKIVTSSSFLLKKFCLYNTSSRTATNSLREKCPYSELFWSVFSRTRTEYGEILRISLYSVRMREDTDQNNSEYGHFLRSDLLELLFMCTYYLNSSIWMNMGVHWTYGKS